ncbi:LEC14B protein isoform X2 [Tripterygium wilfordii]|uniref:LEC14B homolog n=1 Tax=Tripterygium wilfordii TaxID=458696 RepID=A0A7J7CF13_TRIWF|nr:LEC14B protein [Tripterygium wilfordii]XP_038681984.1 LEC14B protein [Tripterygium wilfordii]KAF5732729.1 LEC14B protein isoform X2 [Tripterygium wilfordii]
MYDSWALSDQMGYGMSRLEIDSETCDGGKHINETGSSGRKNRPLNNLDHEVAQLTRLRSEPHEGLCAAIPGRPRLPVSTVKMLAGREANHSGRSRFSTADRCHMLSRYLPVNGPWILDEMTSRAYVSQFSVDGSLFVAAFQGSQIRVYDVENEWKLRKNILAKNLRWAITDTSLSPDQRFLVYSSMSPVVHIVDVGSREIESYANVTEIHDGLDFSTADNRGHAFGIFSVKFSTDGRELVAGSNDDSIYVYDLETNRLSLRIHAHKSDVNTVCFADESGHLIYSGSDDNLCKVWDRRCFRARGKPAGVLLGHLEGITCIDSRGDGRYFISNGKDQSIKLWDVRRMSSSTTCNLGRPRNHEWDYRWMDYPTESRDWKHPADQSVATYKGHSVLRTLIRCYFSPAYSTGQKYIYTGSHDSSVYIYDLVSGDQVAVLKHHKSAVRDCNWHPYYPMLVSSSWDGEVVKWEFPGNGEPSVSRKRYWSSHSYWD